MTLDFATLAGTVGPTAAVLLFMWLNRAPTPKEKAEDPMVKLADKLNAIHTDLQILLDRRVK